MTPKEKNAAEELYDIAIFEIFGKSYKKLDKKIILCQKAPK